MSDREHQERLRGEQLLVYLAMRHEARRPDSPLYTDANIIRWLDEEATAEPPSVPHWSREQVRSVAAWIQAAVCARDARLRQESSAPPLRPATVPGTIPQILDDAVNDRAAPQLDLSAAAGVGRELWDEPCDTWVELPDDVPTGRYLAVRIKGESMVPLFHTGDTILVHVDAPVERGRIILVQMPDGGYAAKKVGRLTTTRIELLSLNPDFAPVVIPRDKRRVIGAVILVWCEHHAGARHIDEHVE